VLQAVIFESTHNNEKYFIQKLYDLKEDFKFQLRNFPRITSQLRNFPRTTSNFQSITSVLEVVIV